MDTIARFNEMFLSDARRYLNDTAFSKFKEKGLLLKYFSIRNIPGLRFSFWMRLCHELRGKKAWLPLYGFAINRYYHYVYHYGISIPFNAQIGKGFYIGHFGCIVVSPAAVMGKNVNISQGVTISKANRGNNAGVPTIAVVAGVPAKIISMNGAEGYVNRKVE